MTIKRYNPWCAESHGHFGREDPDGVFVKYEDYEKLLKKVEDLENELSMVVNLQHD
jgi:hypothetical protein